MSRKSGSSASEIDTGECASAPHCIEFASAGAEGSARRDPSRMTAMSDPPVLPAASAEAIDRFVDALWIEDGLAANTLAAYRRDLTLFARWLRGQARRGRSLDARRDRPARATRWPGTPAAPRRARTGA